MKPIEPDQSVLAEAKKNPDSWVYKIDCEYQKTDYTPPEAIMGAWHVDSSGNIDGQFQPNDLYRPIEQSMRSLPTYLTRHQPEHANMWIAEVDMRCAHLFPKFPKFGLVGYWLVGADGNLTRSFRPSASYDPDALTDFLKSSR